MHSTRLTTIDALAGTQEQTPARMVAGALAHLATHMSTGCPRAGYLAAMLLEKIASDTEADDHLRRHARELVDILDADHITPLRSPPISSFVSVEAS